MARGKKKGGSPKVVVKSGIVREKGYLYFIDKQGDVSMAQMARGKKKKKVAKKKVAKKKVAKKKVAKKKVAKKKVAKKKVAKKKSKKK